MEEEYKDLVLLLKEKIKDIDDYYNFNFKELKKIVNELSLLQSRILDREYYYYNLEKEYYYYRNSNENENNY